MNWVDYRDSLGIGFSSDECFQYFKNNMCSFFRVSEVRDKYISAFLLRFCLSTGIPYPGDYYGEYNTNYILSILSSCVDGKLFISYCVAILNSIYNNQEFHDHFKIFLLRMLDVSRIPFEIVQSDSEVYIYPKGVVEYDKALVSEPLSWLSNYPKAQKAFTVALKQYTNCEFTRDCADNFRKSLEEFLDEFFENSKNLKNNVHTVKDFLKENGASEEVANILVSLINLYDAMNNKIAKHHDLIDAKFLEFLMYQTGLFIRMLIVVRNSTKK